MLSQTIDIPADNVLEALPALLDPQAVLDAVQGSLGRVSANVRAAWREARLLEATYHPGRHVRVVYALLSDPATPDERAWPEGELVYFQSPVRCPMSRRGDLVVMNKTPVEAYVFPNDRRLRGMRTFARRDLCLEAWSAWAAGDAGGAKVDAESLQRLLMRYVPEQKCVVRLRAESPSKDGGAPTKRRLLVRATSPANCGELRHRHQTLTKALSDHGEHFRVARPQGAKVEQGLLALEWLRGDGLLDVLKQGAEAEVFAGIARRLRHWHDLHIEGLAVLGVERLIEKTNDAFIDLCAACPDLVPRMFDLRRSLVGTLRRLPSARLVTLHGDFHWKQLVLKGGQMALLDLERMARGDALIDVANFAAQLEMLAHRPEAGVDGVTAKRWARGFLDAWQQQSGEGIDLQRCAAYAAVSRLELARGRLRHLRPNWRAFCAQATANVEADLELASTVQEAA